MSSEPNKASSSSPTARLIRAWAIAANRPTRPRAAKMSPMADDDRQNGPPEALGSDR